jgi:hypothetical protein
VVQRMDDIPAGVIGLRASGKLSREDYREALEPGLQEAIDTGEARVVFVLTGFDGLEPGAFLEDAKTGLGVELAHRSEWKRLAAVTDVAGSRRRCTCSRGRCPGSLRSTSSTSWRRPRAGRRGESAVRGQPEVLS